VTSFHWIARSVARISGLTPSVPSTPSTPSVPSTPAGPGGPGGPAHTSASYPGVGFSSMISARSMLRPGANTSPVVGSTASGMYAARRVVFTPFAVTRYQSPGSDTSSMEKVPSAAVTAASGSVPYTDWLSALTAGVGAARTRTPGRGSPPKSSSVPWSTNVTMCGTSRAGH
jgi:hypothetical protein